MGRIFCLMGKSASGKDTIYGRLIRDPKLALSPVVPYTTRPIRSGETDGENYHFCTDEEADAMQAAGQVVEMRTYQTVYGPWRYFTADDGQIDLARASVLLIGTPEAYIQLKEFYGREHVDGLYIYADDGVRLQRALDRERAQEKPRYAELCRRFLADEEDFSEERLAAAQVTRRFENVQIDTVVGEIASYISLRSQG